MFPGNESFARSDEAGRFVIELDVEEPTVACVMTVVHPETIVDTVPFRIDQYREVEMNLALVPKNRAAVSPPAASVSAPPRVQVAAPDAASHAGAR